jgi:methionyl aminopeptidase
MATLPRLRSRKAVDARSAGELDAMAAAGAVVAAALRAVHDAARPGVSTLALDAIAEAVIRDSGGTPSFLGYHGYPASICSSVNDRVVHGIPSGGELLAPGDLVSIDCGAIVDGWHGDSAVTFGVGPMDAADEALSAATRESMEAGIAAMIPGNRLSDVSHAIERATRSAEGRYGRRFGIVAGYGGHGIGRQMHMDPFLANEGRPGRGPVLAPGSVLAIEPMLTLGAVKTRVLDDEWTVVTADGSRAAHWEHTVAATHDGPRILTLPQTLPHP